MQPLICVGCSVHYWVSCAINKGGFFEIAFVVVVLVETHLPILGDPGEVSRVGRKGGTKVFKYGQKSSWVPTLTIERLPVKILISRFVKEVNK